MGCTSAGGVTALPLISRCGARMDRPQRGPLVSHLMFASTLKLKEHGSWCSFKNPQKSPLMLVKNNNNNKNAHWARSSDLTQKFEAPVGFSRGTGRRAWLDAIPNTCKQTNDGWFLASWLVFWKDPASSSGSCSTQEPALRRGCRGAPLLPRSHPLLRCSQHNNAGMITPFSPLNHAQECPALRNKKKKKENKNR